MTERQSTNSLRRSSSDLESTLSACCCALAPTADMDQKAAAIDGTDRRTDEQTDTGPLHSQEISTRFWRLCWQLRRWTSHNFKNPLRLTRNVNIIWLKETIVTKLTATGRIATIAQTDPSYSPAGANVHPHLIHGYLGLRESQPRGLKTNYITTAMSKLCKVLLCNYTIYLNSFSILKIAALRHIRLSTV